MSDPDLLDDVPDQKIPRHIAVIMDGNGRWAVQRGLERVRGHQQGARSVRDVVTECARLRKERGGPDFLTLYSFSLENWKRPADEVTFLMQMDNDGLTLVLALNYSSRAEITDAVRAIGEKVKSGELAPRDVTESTISDHL